MIIDEPTEGLAPKLVVQVAKLLDEIARRGVSILLVEQKLTIALKISHRLYVMGHGRIVEAFLGAVADAGDGIGLPQFVEREFREFLMCDVFEGGVARSSVHQRCSGRLVDGRGVPRVACRSPGSARSTREEAVSVRCAVGCERAVFGSWHLMSR